MIHTRKIRLPFNFKWAISNFSGDQLGSSENSFRPALLYGIAQNPITYATKRAAKSSHCDGRDATLTAKKENAPKFSPTTLKEAQAALLDYLHYTRGLQFLDADNMSRNSPYFVEELLKKVRNGDIRRSITRYLRYHPINEFEPFFESVGLKPSEYISFLPRDLMFLRDDQLLLENYETLCNYGIPRNKIGKIYKEATQVFHYCHGVLSSKLQAYEELGLRNSSLVKVVASSPYVLIGDTNLEIVKVLEKLKHFGKDINWVEEHMLDGTSYNWGQMLEVLRLLSKFSSEEQLGEMIKQHPDFLFEDSGGRTFSLIGFFLKLGLSKDQISLIFLKFPEIQFGKFLWNLRRCFLFLSDIKMVGAEIGKIFQSHSLLLGSFTLKKTNTLIASLNIGRKRLCRFIRDNPQELKNLAIGRKLKPLPKEEDDDIKSQMQKMEFLSSLGYQENSQKLKYAFKVFRGKGAELQERFDCIVNAGLDYEDACEMINMAPQILNLTTDVINMKINCLVKELGYPISSLVNFPAYLSYTPQRVKLRVSMYNWLRDEGCVDPKLALSTLVASTEKTFINQYVNRHPTGPRVWQDLKKKIYSEKVKE
ncbi:hypothetical protein L6164_009443 [Bauhinia variegata]|uniref:Uncharacterized protein n=1 Tax=Bauhinia variegata TaxID=167791 RepID=A0ACB9PJY9_BAUVA|nr:hypothetical protein L6164_009443 [Bauhinia variegata]